MKIGFLIILDFSYFHTQKDAPNIHRAFQNVCKASEMKISGRHMVSDSETMKSIAEFTPPHSSLSIVAPA